MQPSTDVAKERDRCAWIVQRKLDKPDKGEESPEVVAALKEVAARIRGGVTAPEVK